MSTLATIASLMSGLGLFFLGVRGLSASLVPLIGRRARAAFAAALQGQVSCAASGIVAGLVTQSSTAVSWIIVSFVKGGVLGEGKALLAPTWANVGTALLPMIVAIDTSVAAGLIIGIVGFATYFKLARGDRLRQALDAALGAALLLFGMHLVSVAVEPLREGLMQNAWWDAALQSPLLLAAIGGVFALAAQSSSVAAAIAVAAVATGLLDLAEALPLVVGANFAGALNNALLIPGESAAGRVVFGLQVVQKLGGTLLLLVLFLYGAIDGEALANLLDAMGEHAAAQLAVLFVLAQVAGALITNLMEKPTRRLLRRLKSNTAETLGQPAFLMREALNDPTTALDLALRELARLTARLPQMLDHVRDEAVASTPPPMVLRAAGLTLTGTVKAYLASLLDRQLASSRVSSALLLDDVAATVAALNEALAEFVDAASPASQLPSAGRLIEALHAILEAVADHAASLGAEDPELVLSLLGHRDQLMDELRHRLSTEAGVAPRALDGLFRMTVLFERIVWLSRRLVNGFSQAHRSLGADM
ncbi:Na/Pi cotransporter family protein [Ancylobacter pratisalsi]|uniref:Na/Pi cotransporter family protein n=1 Tax=Ancylobacter pratisalsi TaxID=1745854 RepID=A0A6P1YRV4_9HYPH|nr:Na/Pi cotransporter family protein [Ancylobacter pratisalsi]QIB35610.1 Na/Pi cotransporter family protein [Ancylobacter pratisalsi]